MPTPNVPTINWSTLSTEQLRRAYALILVRLIWPTTNEPTALSIARWIVSGTTPAGER